MIPVKICGITNLKDAMHVSEAGAKAIGFIFYNKSPRCITIDRASRISKEINNMIKIGVFVNPHFDLVNEAIKKVPIDIIQFHGNETDAFIKSFNIPKIKVIKVKDNIEDFFEFNNTLLFDTYSNTSEGGTGRAFNWNLLNHYKKQNFILSGGLNNGNILKAISTVNPGAIDICSGLEKKPGHKCHQKVNEFFQKIKNTKETEFDFAKLSN